MAEFKNLNFAEKNLKRNIEELVKLKMTFGYKMLMRRRQKSFPKGPIFAILYFESDFEAQDGVYGLFICII